MGEILKKTEKGLVVLLIFLLPTQLAIHFWPSWAFVYGIRIDYLSPAIYLTDVLIGLLFIFGFKETLKYKKYLAIFILFALINIYFSTNQMVSMFRWFKVLEFTALAIYFSERLKFVGHKIVLNTLFTSLVFFSTIGILQFLLGHTIGGLFYWLGERTFTTGTPGIALNSFFGVDVLRAYSTFPHPNALAGYLGVSIIFLFTNNYFKKNNKLFWLLIIVSCFLLTFSLSAFFGMITALIVGVLFKNNDKLVNYIFGIVVLLSLLMPTVSNSLSPNFVFNKNISERLDLAVISGKIISQHFWIGGGLGTFIVNMPFVKPTTTSSWLLQPVHNIFLLILSEIGVFGFLSLIYFFSKGIKVFPLVFLFILVTGFVDHYWFDSQQNLLLISLISGLAFKAKK